MTNAHHSEPLQRSDCGLALVELLVAFALLAMISTLLVTAYRTGSLTLASFERRLSAPGIESVNDVLSNLLIGARNIKNPPDDASDQVEPAFVGHADRAQFIAVVEKRGHYSGLYRVSIGTRQLSTDAVSRALTVQLKLYRREGATVVKPVGHSPHSQFALLPGVEALQFGYYGRADGDDLARWHRTWASRRNLPQVVSIQVSVFSGPSDRRSQTLFIALPVARID